MSQIVNFLKITSIYCRETKKIQKVTLNYLDPKGSFD